MDYLKNIAALKRNERVGNKAHSLRILHKKGFIIPETFVLAPKAKADFKLNKDSTRSQLSKEIDRKLDLKKKYAIRSSSEMEDQKEYTMAGQYLSLLNVEGEADLFNAIQKVWESAENNTQIPFSSLKVSDNPLMGVIIQEMIQPEWAGVCFSINPVTGRNEIVIEGVKGLADSFLQDGITPHRWVFCQGNWEISDESDYPGNELLFKIVTETERLRKFYKNEIDVEWVYDGNELYFIQARTVTAQGYPTIYSNYISREFLPGMIKPLVWSVNIPLVNSAWIKLLENLCGKLNISPEQLSHSFHYRAYFNMGTMGAIFKLLGFPPNSLESLMGRKDPSGKSAFRPGLKTFRYLPGMLWFLLRNIRLGRKFSKNFKKISETIDDLKNLVENDFPVEKQKEIYLTLQKDLKVVAYYNIIIPLAMQITNKLFRKKLEKKGFSYEEVDFAQDFAELKNYDPSYEIKKLHTLWIALSDLQKENLKTNLNSEFKEDKILGEFAENLNSFKDRFGHFSESGNDFSTKSWKEDLAFILHLVQTSSKQNISKSGGGINHKIKHSRSLNRAYKRAGQFKLYREMISSEYTRGYGLFRTYFLKLGKTLTEAGVLNQTEDIFYLNLTEVNNATTKSLDNKHIYIEKARKVKEEMKSLKDIKLPSVIYGSNPPPVQLPDEQAMKGISVSSGVFEGEIVVINGYEDFNKAVENSILVIPYSDVGWTPILSRAGAIVSESGGMLSHAAIIAREMGIPAIVSVDFASALKDGTPAKVDANNGYLIIK